MRIWHTVSSDQIENVLKMDRFINYNEYKKKNTQTAGVFIYMCAQVCVKIDRYIDIDWEIYTDCER